MLYNCSQCKKPFTAPASANRKFCSRICARAPKPISDRRKYVSSTCKTCCKEFQHYFSSKRLYCSRPCFVVFLAKFLSERSKGSNNPMWKEKVFKPCETCGKPFHLKIARARFCSMSCMGEQRKGDKNPSWKGGSKVRNPRGFKYGKWREAVLLRDERKCKRCGTTKKLHAHHIKPWATHPDLRFTVSNGIILCLDCHWIAHRQLSNDGRCFVDDL